ncbi:ABC transporter permease [Halovulum dunhuangense]|uniref:ABC transporter permease n=1 Tax=Halovulum dunhuangense TaxID=1505036 RepID=A0A849KZD2_9RHOB|nr:ABC transporter permease [Halovulum dunhuangense]NNU79492.1 ABC transporter permease [Halovulum dunhuangense]
MRTMQSVLIVVGGIMAIWLAAVPFMNIKWEANMASRAGVEVSIPEGGLRRASAVALVFTNPHLIPGTYVQEKPRLPGPQQVVAELWATTAGEAVTSNRSLVYHAGVTLTGTVAGFLFGTALGVLLAVAIVHVRVIDASIMPWVIASQTIPILALAPMIIVVMNSVGITGLVPKAIISAYLSFFPVVVGMVKGLRSPDAMQMDLLKTYNASAAQTFWKLRLPAAAPFLFPSLKIGIAASLVGAIVGELPTGAVAGLGARLLAGSYYGQTVQIWSALFGAAILAAILVGAVGLIQAFALKRMGFAR